MSKQNSLGSKIQFKKSQQSSSQWLGIGFKIASQTFVAPLGEVAEVMAMPEKITLIPLAKPWVLGAINVRGRLFTIINVTEFLGMASLDKGPTNKTSVDVATINRQTRNNKLIGNQSVNTYKQKTRVNTDNILLVNQNELCCGLAVDKVFGILKFNPTDYVAEQPPKEAPYLRYSHGKFVNQGKSFKVFLPSLLIQDERFLNIAI